MSSAVSLDNTSLKKGWVSPTAISAVAINGPAERLASALTNRSSELTALGGGLANAMPGFPCHLQLSASRVEACILGAAVHKTAPDEPRPDDLGLTRQQAHQGLSKVSSNVHLIWIYHLECPKKLARASFI